MLSEGRIEADGTLACAYHGWRFDGEGNCTTLPQTFGAAELDKAVSNKKSCAVSYPVQVKSCLVPLPCEHQQLNYCTAWEMMRVIHCTGKGAATMSLHGPNNDLCIEIASNASAIGYSIE